MTELTRSRVHPVIGLSKPGVTMSAVMTGAWGVLATGHAELWTATAALVGVGLMVAAAGALNMAAEADTDRQMPRTCERPVACGQVSVRFAAAAAVAWSTLASAVLVTFGNPFAAALGIGALLVYAGVYTPLKRVSPIALLVGAIPGAAPPLIAGAALTGTVEPAVLGLFALLFLWQIPHFGGIVVRRGDEYRAAGLRIAPPKGRLPSVRRGIIACALLLAVAPVAGLPLAGWSPLFALGAALAAVPMVRTAARPADDWSAWGRRVFLSSLPYVPVVALISALDALV